MITGYHAKYFAHHIAKKGGTGLEKLSQSIMNATVDFNPHQVEAALFALRSPFSRGVMLADEVGLGKTIEAGLVISQLWAENKRKIVIILPASLRKQWQMELADKFNVPAVIVDTRTYKKHLKEGVVNPVEQPSIVLCSYHFASRYCEDFRAAAWDLVVFDEAHKLRNSYRKSSKMGQRIRWAFEERKKLLLTATPFQNSLSELYGLISLIDEYFFGDYPTFRTMYANADGDLIDLRERIKTICKRTLREDVLEFVKYTERSVETISFRPTEDEHRLYLAVTSFLQRENTYAVPDRQKHLTAVILRKMLASSPMALAGTLRKILKRLEELKEKKKSDQFVLDFEDEDYDEDFLEDFDIEIENETEEEEGDIDLEQLSEEIDEVKSYISWAESIGTDTKSSYLTKALEIGFCHMAEMKAEKKAVIFTESRKTQKYLREFLENNGYAGKTVTFSGSNKDPNMKKVFAWWKETYPDKITGSRTVDKRQAIVDYFRDEAKVLIATQAAGEGINLQFCSLLINYDLPWNPQRVEQRVGRIHRYGQQHDVVIINFLNARNRTDRRVYELLRHKFNLFEGLMGASDEVIGQLQSSSAFEQRITDIYLNCRTPEEIERKFEELQKELDAHIRKKMKKTRKEVLEHLDEEVHSLFKIDYNDALKQMDEVNRKFWKLSKFILRGKAEFDDNSLTFILKNAPHDEIWPGKYRLNIKTDVRQKDTPEYFTEKIYRISHPLGEHCIKRAKNIQTGEALLEFNLSDYPHKISALSDIKGKRGVLTLQKVTIESGDTEDRLLFSARLEDGKALPHETVEKLFRLDGVVRNEETSYGEVRATLEKDAAVFRKTTVRKVFEEKNRYFMERREELYRWADDVVKAAERELVTLKNELRSAERKAREATTIDEQKEAEEKVQKLSRAKRKARSKIFEVEDRIEEKRDALIKNLEGSLSQKVSGEEIFTIGFCVK